MTSDNPIQDVFERARLIERIASFLHPVEAIPFRLSTRYTHAILPREKLWKKDDLYAEGARLHSPLLCRLAVEAGAIDWNELLARAARGGYRGCIELCTVMPFMPEGEHDASHERGATR